MAQKQESNISVQAYKAANNPSLYRCPRCFQWHNNPWNLKYKADKEEDNVKYSDRHIMCDKCERTLWIMANDGSDHPAALAAKQHCESLGRTLD